MSEVTHVIDIGTAYAMSLTCLDENRDPENLTGYTAFGSVKSSVNSADVVLDLHPTIPTPASGVVLVNADTTGLAAGQYVWDVQIQNGSNLPIVIASGIVKFRKKVTDTPA